jgi:putative acetyltransferase
MRNDCEPMHIRPETKKDLKAIAAVTRMAFGKEDEVRMIEAIRASDGFVSEFSLVAEAEGRVVGHVLLSYVGLAGRKVLELGPLSVEPRLQGRKIGSLLVWEALRRVELRGEPLVLVVGHPEYYARFGFFPASRLGIKPPVKDIPEDAFMALPLPGYEPSLRGRVEWPPAFSA